MDNTTKTSIFVWCLIGIILIGVIYAGIVYEKNKVQLIQDLDYKCKSIGYERAISTPSGYIHDYSCIQNLTKIPIDYYYYNEELYIIIK